MRQPLLARSTELALLLLVAGVAAPIGMASAVAASDATLTGRVVAEGGGPTMTHTRVSVQQLVGGKWQPLGMESAYDYTDFAGDYSVTVPAGTYRLEFEQLDHLLHHVSLTLVPGEARTLDVELARGAAIAGKVTLPAGGPRTNAFVRVYAQTPLGAGPSSWTQVDYAYVEPSGAYSASGFPGGTYRVGVLPDNAAYPPEFWDNVTAVELARDIAVATDGTVAGIDFDLGTAPETPEVGPGPVVTTTKAPRLKGRVQVGKRLKVRFGKVVPVAATVRYRWFAGKSRLKRVDGPILRLTRAQAGKRVSVKVVLRAPGYTKAVIRLRASAIPRPPR